MPNWNTPAELARDTEAFLKLQFVMTGLYCWEYLVSLNFEWSFITGERQFRWPLIFYFLSRYCALGLVIVLQVSLNLAYVRQSVTIEVSGTEDSFSDANLRPLHCTAMYVFMFLFGQLAMGFSSLTLALRTMALWRRDIRVVIPLGLLIAGHWAVLLQACNVSGQWVEGTGCVLTQPNTTQLTISFSWSILLDAIVFILSAIKIVRPGFQKRSGMVRMVFKDGLVYLFVAMCANAMAAVFMALNLNTIMQVMFNAPAVLTATIGTNRAVRRLVTYASEDFYVYSTEHIATSVQAAAADGIVPIISPPPKNPRRSLHVQVEMDTFITEDPEDKYAIKKKRRPL
ncbi:hypothetical protein BXZ70DRAFT_33869 [Cristinia sonorae]|uniref:Transmembrane protein n=1 Tax=Cristinia sonorae TaxID=1940300 RepID=A0A8K0UYA3_9AGAR|nr:hypothetical protein BXZ70DRAFT_33869 [Cristinia sonorae]